MKEWPNTSLTNFGPLVGPAAFNSKMERVLEGLRLAGFRSDLLMSLRVPCHRAARGPLGVSQ